MIEAFQELEEIVLLLPHTKQVHLDELVSRAVDRVLKEEKEKTREDRH